MRTVPRGTRVTSRATGLSAELSRRDSRRLFHGFPKSLVSGTAFSTLARRIHRSELLCVPIRVESEVVGTLSVDLPRPGAGSPGPNACASGKIIASMIAYDVRSRQTEMMHCQNPGKPKTSGFAKPWKNASAGKHSRQIPAHARGVPEDPPGRASTPRWIIRGESGTENCRLGRPLQQCRAHAPFVKVNFARTLNENLLESELSGHEKGRSTGAFTRDRHGSRRPGRNAVLGRDRRFFSRDPSPSCSAPCRNAIPARGSNQTVKADVRIMPRPRGSGGQRRVGPFPPDLYIESPVFPISLPPLRDRQGDICSWPTTSWRNTPRSWERRWAESARRAPST